MAKKKPTFEEALNRLESITEQIERGQIGLEESISRYEEGMKLVRYCRTVLGKAEQRIEQLHLGSDEPTGGGTASSGPDAKEEIA
ncbi:MAG: exodeoxyribonuclease VII small subunit [bacterium]|nr:exodeoxyribonuclease VII small subunit [bacterium]